MAAELEERFYETNRAQLLRWLPWLHLFRAFRIALDVRKIVLGTLAVFVLAKGDALIDTLPFAPAATAISTNDASFQLFGFELRREASPADGASNVEAASGILFPLWSIIEPGSRLFERGNSWADVAWLWTRLLFRLAVWSLLGGAIARIAAVQFARREGLTARSALAFSARRFGATMGAPLLPLLFIGCFWLLCAAGGLIARIPGVGEVIVGALWFLPLLIGIALAVMLLVIALGWPLMVATISTEGTDAFDGLSRGYDYVLNRTWYALWLLLLTVVYGTIVIAFAGWIANEGVRLANWGVASGSGDVSAFTLLPENTPALASTLSPDPVPDTLGGAAAMFWLNVFAWLLRGFTVSYFWTAVTIIYFLLRLSLDAKPLSDVYMPAAAGPGETLPLVGIAAAERREAASGETGAQQPPG